MALQARSIEITATLVGTDALHDDKFVEVAGRDHAEGVTVNTEFSADDSGAGLVQSFVAAIRSPPTREAPGRTTRSRTTRCA